MYIYDIAGTPRLERILTASDRTILNIAWCPHDPNVIAMAVAEEQHNLLLWDVQSESLTKRMSAIGAPAKFIAWAPSHASELVSASLLGVITRSTTAGVPSAVEVPWQSRAGQTSSELAKRDAPRPGYPALPRLSALRLNALAADRYALGFESGLLVVLTGGVVTMDVPHKDDAMSDAQWDPKSPNYLLAGLRSGKMHMYDVDSGQSLQSFEQLREGGLQMIAWVPHVPGDFVTVSDKTGVIRVWNVSNRQPKDTLKAEAGPFQGISFIHNTQRALCRFKSGAVGLCDLQKRTWSMFGRSAHTDTVFNAAFQPSNANMLATCSFDGSVRIWDTGQARLFRDLVGEDVGVLYSIAWSPHDPTRLATCWMPWPSSSKYQWTWPTGERALLVGKKTWPRSASALALSVVTSIDALPMTVDSI